VVSYLDKRNANYALLHCNSTYPAPFQDINLRWIEQLRKIHPLVGYSGHERGSAVSLAATALGASIIERHFTLDRSMEGPDHAASLEFDEFKKLVEGIRQVEMAMGDGSRRAISQGEMINRENLGKSLVAKCDIVAGTKITSEHVMVKSPGQGLSPQLYEKLIGQVIAHDMKREDFFFDSDIHGGKLEPKNYKFNRPWGVPIRYHDFGEYKSKINPDFFEFHLSYSDMKLNPKDYLRGNYDSGFVVHAPELFENSCLMDLASPDDDYRNYSIAETQKVIDITKRLNDFFPNQVRPMIVANLGGFTMDQPLDSEKIPAYYERLANSIDKLDLTNVELLPQTMAPFPWHFGGQRYQNLFVKIDEIIYWCERLNLRMCFDISHTSLTCKHLGYDFYEFAQKIAPITAHLHLGDARGVNGEGLQVGDGEIDFDRLGKILQQGCPNASFIPEIWQGHKNGGEGFWIALDRLEGLI
jgi:sugar phosphate isomerase/epimerase